MNYFKTSLFLLLIYTIGFSQEPAVIKYPFKANKPFVTIERPEINVNLNKSMLVSSDNKYGLWFIEKKEVHFFNFNTGEWELFNSENGLFNGFVGVIFHDSRGNTWIGSIRQAFFNGYGAIRLYSGGVSLYNGDSLRLFSAKTIESESPEIATIAEGPDNEIFVSTGNPFKSGPIQGLYPSGLFRYKNEQWHNFSKGSGGIECPIRLITRVHTDLENNVWMVNYSKHELCYYDGERFVVPENNNLKDYLLLAFNEKYIWVYSLKGFSQYNFSTKEYTKLGNVKRPVIKPIVLGENLICYLYMSTTPIPSKKNLEKLVVQIIDQGKFYSSQDYKLTKKMYFKTAATFNENTILLGSNQGIINYNNGEFYRDEVFNSLNSKTVRTIYIGQNNKAFIICDDGETFLYDGSLTKIVLTDDQSAVTCYTEASNGDILFSTGTNAYLVKSSTSNNEVEKLAGDLNNCSQIFENNNKLFCICSDGIISVNY